MRQFSAEYLEATRVGMWDDSRAALDGLALPSRERVLDVGCGTGELTRVLREESPGTVVGLDADRELLASVDSPRVQGDAVRLPFADDSFDLVVCQALLVNLPDPAAAVAEFRRVSTDLVAAIEPDNAAVSVTSSADPEARLSRRAREMYLDGVSTNAALGADAADVFEDVGLSDVRTSRYDHERRIDPPYSEQAVQAARRKASGDGLEVDRETMLAGDATPEDVDDLRAAWREMGRDVIRQMQTEDYRRREVVPFFVTIGSVSPG
ncbi:class I SAM-dependent methyltransferase [Halorientalis halophila]|uniref:class I SAM-dependent methyltransferase n=1 Tax=Halorientalis halophila TaxID=3108499 RepID=UPI003AB66E54